MIYTQKLPTVDAHLIMTTGQAAQLTGSDPAEPWEGEDWAVEMDIPTESGVIRGHMGGRTGDYLYRDGTFWVRVPAAEFEATWEPFDIALRTSTLRESDLHG